MWLKKCKQYWNLFTWYNLDISCYIYVVNFANLSPTSYVFKMLNYFAQYLSKYLVCMKIKKTELQSKSCYYYSRANSQISSTRSLTRQMLCDN